MTKSEKLVQFYSECQAKGYTDMTDATQSLKAKVIASDLKLPYGKIAELYATAKKEFEADRQKKALEAQAAAAEAERLSKKGTKLLTLYGTIDGEDRIVNVYRRDDESVYCHSDSSSKIEGIEFSVTKGGVLSYNYHPSQTVYTGASAGGIHMGGFHETKAYVSQGYSSSGKGDIVAVFGSSTMKLDEVEVSDNVQKAFKRDESFQSLADEDGTITCIDSKGYASARFMATSALSSRADIYTKQNMLSQAVDMKRLPMEKCKAIADLLNRIIYNDCPPSDEDYYKKADKLFQEGSLQSLSDSIELFKFIGDYKDSAKRAAAARERFEELEQQAKEQAILKQERFNRIAKKVLKIVLPILAVLLLFIIILTTVIIPGKKHKEAMALIEAGNYDAGYSILEELRKDEEIAKIKYDQAMALVEAGEYDAACSILKELGKSEEVERVKYDQAMSLVEAGEYNAACSILKLLGKDEEAAKVKYDHAMALVEAGNYDEGCSILEALGKNEDAAKVRYDQAMDLIKSKDYKAAYNILKDLNYKDSEEKRKLVNWELLKTQLPKVKKGSKVIFGTYEQDDDISNGKEDIEWRVLAKDDNKVLLISRYALDCQVYDPSFSDVTWETCSLRKWLNSTFLNQAFDKKEQKKIQSVRVTADRNPHYNTSPGNNTNDKVFILSFEEAKKYFRSDEARACEGTAYCYAQGAYEYYTGNCYWWLRTPADKPYKAAAIRCDGSLAGGGTQTYDDDMAVRPVLWISIE